ncbi:hypothetical protein ACTFIY_011879 [Dictyostelium cf. discoideum]
MDYDIKFTWDKNQYLDQEIRIPKYTLPWDFKSSPFDKDFENQEMEYVKQFFENYENAVNYVKKNEIGKIAALNFPLGEKDEYMVNSKLLDFLFILDDYIYESRNYEEDYVDNLMDKSSKSHDSFGCEIWRLFDEYYRVGVKESVDLLIKDFEFWSRSAIKTNKYKSLNSSLSIEDYFNSRHGDFGMTITASSCTSTLYVENEIRESKDFKKFFKYFELCNLMINDCGSFKMEINEILLTNFVKVRAIQVGSIDLALKYCVDLLNKYVIKVDKYSTKLEEQYPYHSHLKKYIYTLKTFTAGHNKGYGHANRYN